MSDEMIYVKRRKVPPVAILGYTMAGIAALFLYSSLIVTCNDGNYDGIIESTCQPIVDENRKIIDSELVIITDERNGVRRRIVLDVKCKGAMFHVPGE